MSQLHQPKELLYYRDHTVVSAADGKQTGAEFAGQIVSGGSTPLITLPHPSEVPREQCFFVSGAYSVQAPDGASMFINGTDASTSSVSMTNAGLLLRSDGLRYIGFTLGFTLTASASITPTYTVKAGELVYSFNATYNADPLYNASGSMTVPNDGDDLTFTAKEWSDQINTTVYAPNGYFYFEDVQGVLRLILQNEDTGTFYDTVQVTFGSSLPFLNSQYTLSSPVAGSKHTIAYTVLVLG